MEQNIPQEGTEAAAAKGAKTKLSDDAVTSAISPIVNCKTCSYEQRIQNISKHMMAIYGIPNNLNGLKAASWLNTKLNLRERLQYVYDPEIYRVLRDLFSERSIDNLCKGEPVFITYDDDLPFVIQDLLIEMGFDINYLNRSCLFLISLNKPVCNHSKYNEAYDVFYGAQASRMDFLSIQFLRRIKELQIFGHVAIYLPDTTQSDDPIILNAIRRIRDWARFVAEYRFVAENIIDYNFCEDCKVLNVYMRHIDEIKDP